MSSTAEIAHLFRALKAPAAAHSLPKLADRARAEEWSYERFAEALLSTEVASRGASGGEPRIRALSGTQDPRKVRPFLRALAQEGGGAHLAQLNFLHARENIVLLGPSGIGKTHLGIAIGVRACLAGQRVAFATATEWVARLADAPAPGHPGGRDRTASAHPADRRRRGRLHPLRSSGGQPDLPAGVGAL